MKNLQQDKIIAYLNQYLKQNNFDLELNGEGVCNGLAAVFAKYTLEGRQDDFFNKLEALSSRDKNYQHDDKFNEFVYQILITFLPERYNKKLRQENSFEALGVGFKHLKSGFDFTLGTEAKNWIKIFKQIGLDKDEAMLINSPNHAIAVAKDGKGYIIYDPNYETGFKKAGDARALVKELNNIFNFGPYGTTMAMDLRIIGHPDKKPRNFPDTIKLYETYLDKNMIKAQPMGSFMGSKYTDTLNMAAKNASQKEMEKLLEIGSDLNGNTKLSAAILAANRNNNEALMPLLNHLFPQKN